MLKDQSDLVEVRFYRGQVVGNDLGRVQVLTLLRHLNRLVLVLASSLAEIVKFYVPLVQENVLHRQLVVENLLVAQLFVSSHDPLEQTETGNIRHVLTVADEVLQILVEVLVNLLNCFTYINMVGTF